MVLEGGTWRGARIVPAAWVAQMTQPQATSDTTDQIGQLFPYGYYWWIVPGGAAAWGNEGQHR